MIALILLCIFGVLCALAGAFFAGMEFGQERTQTSPKASYVTHRAGRQP